MQALIDSLRKEEVSLQEKVESLHHRKASNAIGLVALHKQLRDVEHKLCLKVWDIVHDGERERESVCVCVCVCNVLSTSVVYVVYCTSCHCHQLLSICRYF